jgi:hypothetical protein
MFTKLLTTLTVLVIVLSLVGWSQFVDGVADPATVQIDTRPHAALSATTQEDWRVLMEEITLVQLLSESYARVETVCAGNGLKNIAPSPDGPKIIIPNAGDLSVEGSNVAANLDSDGTITFIPRVPGQRIRVPMDLGDKLTGHEVTSLTLAEARQLVLAGKMVWTAKGQGPYGNGHGLPGHIAECDPLYTGSDK